MQAVSIKISVNNIEEAIRFYSAIFGRAPTDASADQARWSFDDPEMDFAIAVASTWLPPPTLIS